MATSTLYPAGRWLGGVALSPDGTTLYVANSGDLTLSVISVATRTVIGTIAIPPDQQGDTPFSIAVANNGTALVSTNNPTDPIGLRNNRLLQVDLATGSVTQRSDVDPSGAIPGSTFLAVSGDHSTIAAVPLLVTQTTVAIYHTATDSFVSTAQMGGHFDAALDATGGQLLLNPGTDLYDGDGNALGHILSVLPGLGIAVSPSGDVAYEALESGAVGVLDLRRGLLVGSLPLPEGLLLNTVSTAPMAISPDGSTLAVVTASGLSVVSTAPAGLSPQPCADLAVRATAAGTVFSFCGAALGGLVLDHSGHAFATNPEHNEVEVVDLPTGTVEPPIQVGDDPLGLAISRDGSTLYVADSGSEAISVVDVATRREAGHINVPGSSDYPFSLGVASNGQLVLTTSFAGSGVGGRVLQIDPTTGSISPLVARWPGAANTSEDAKVITSADHTHIAVVAGDTSSGDVALFDLATGTTNTVALNAFVHSGALDATGSTLLVPSPWEAGASGETRVLDGTLSVTDSIPGGGYSVAIGPTGNDAYRVQTDSVDVLDLVHDSVAGSLPLPEAMGGNITFPTSGGAPAVEVAVTTDGSQLVVLTQSGLSLVPLGPAATITGGPPALTNANSGEISFTATDARDPQAPVAVTCSLDGGPAQPCSAPFSYAGLPDGSHNVVVAVSGAGGLTDLASTAWTIDTATPQITLTAHPADPTTDPSATFAFTGADPEDPSARLSWTCSWDGNTPFPCGSPVTDQFGLGPHNFTFQATDPAGNTGSLTFAWTVTAPAPSPSPSPAPSPQPSHSPPSSPPPSSSPSPMPPATPGPSSTAPADDAGYWMLDARGNVYAFGGAPWAGDAPATGSPAISLAAAPGGSGYWVVDKVGVVSAFGTATILGGSPPLRSGEWVTSISATPDGGGYWLFTSQGRVFPYGSAEFLGDMGAVRLNAPVIGFVATSSGRGYYMVAADGGIFTFGDAVFSGSMGGQHLNRAVVGLVPNPAGPGYWLVAADGGIFSFGPPFLGSMGATPLNGPVVGMVAYGSGYLMVASDGGVFDFSSSPFAGSLGGQVLAAPVVGIAAR